LLRAQDPVLYGCVDLVLYGAVAGPACSHGILLPEGLKNRAGVAKVKGLRPTKQAHPIDLAYLGPVPVAKAERGPGDPTESGRTLARKVFGRPCLGMAGIETAPCPWNQSSRDAKYPARIATRPTAK